MRQILAGEAIAVEKAYYADRINRFTATQNHQYTNRVHLRNALYLVNIASSSDRTFFVRTGRVSEPRAI